MHQDLTDYIWNFTQLKGDGTAFITLPTLEVNKLLGFGSLHICSRPQ